jgi:hypothetical protein
MSLDLREAHLEGAHLEGAHLEGAHLEGANLRRTYLEGTNLELAHLRGAHLQSASLYGADLIDADLEGAHLTGAILDGARLNGAYLAGASLERAHLQGAILDGADLRGAFLSGAYLEGAALYRTALCGAWLAGAHLDGADLHEAYLAGADMSNVVGAYWARGLETTQYTPPNNRSVGPPIAPEQALSEPEPSRFPTDYINDALHFETCIRPWPERWLDWERLRVVGRLPLFGASYTALILIPILFYGLALYNDQVVLVRAWAEQVMTQPDHLFSRLASLTLTHLHPRPIPQQSLLLFVSTILLAVGSTLYTFFCPSRIKEFSRGQWCDQLRRSLLHYWPLAWKHRYIRLVCTACYALGGAGALWVLGTKLWRVLVFIFN